jgi:hypothetical protein
MINMRPVASYAFVYPFPPESVRRIAYHFDFDYRPDEAPDGHADEVIRFAKAWRRKSERGLLSSIALPGGSLLLRDTRACATMPERELRGHEAAAYEFCDQFRPFPAIVRHLRERSPEEEITEAAVGTLLKCLAADYLMLTDGVNWLSLAVRAKEAPSSRGSRFGATPCKLPEAVVA